MQLVIWETASASPTWAGSGFGTFLGVHEDGRQYAACMAGLCIYVIISSIEDAINVVALSLSVSPVVTR